MELVSNEQVLSNALAALAVESVRQSKKMEGRKLSGTSQDVPRDADSAVPSLH